MLESIIQTMRRGQSDPQLNIALTSKCTTWNAGSEKFDVLAMSAFTTLRPFATTKKPATWTCLLLSVVED